MATLLYRLGRFSYRRRWRMTALWLVLLALFGVGAVTASLVWFVSLGLGARRLSGLFATPLTWRILDALIAITMTGLGVSLALS